MVDTQRFWGYGVPGSPGYTELRSRITQFRRIVVRRTRASDLTATRMLGPAEPRSVCCCQRTR
jgi:hypothetical protein